MKAWIGKWLIFVSIGHTVVGILLFGDIYKEMISDGLLGTVVSERTAAPVWFLLFIASLLIITIEKHDSLNIPNSIALLLFILTTLGVILMPMSGFWLVYPAVIGIVLKNKRG